MLIKEDDSIRPGNTNNGATVLRTPAVDEIPVGGRNGETISENFVSFFRPQPVPQLREPGSVGPPTGLSSFVGAPGIFFLWLSVKFFIRMKAATVL
jgi:hypothetical protein